MNNAEIWVFDAYGTLFDVHAAIRAVGEDENQPWAAISRTWREKQLAYTWLLAASGDYADFGELTERALDYALARHGATGTRSRAALLSAYEVLPAVSGAEALLRHLKHDRHASVAILSNATVAMVGDAAAANGLGAYVDLILSADTVRTYKPDPNVYRLIEAIPGFVERSAVRFVSANAWDAYHASAFGMDVVWINREAEPAEGIGKPPRQVVTELDQVLGLIGGWAKGGGGS